MSCDCYLQHIYIRDYGKQKIFVLLAFSREKDPKILICTTSQRRSNSMQFHNQVSINLMSVYFYSYEEQFQPKELQYQKGQTVSQLLQQLLCNQQLADELGFELIIESIIIVLKSNPKRSVQLGESVDTLVREARQESLQLLVVCPKEEGGVVIEYIVNKRDSYYENYVNKNDQLQTFIAALCKRINLYTKFQIIVNGLRSDQHALLEKKTIKQLIGSSGSQKITVEINQYSKKVSQNSIAQHKNIQNIIQGSNKQVKMGEGIQDQSQSISAQFSMPQVKVVAQGTKKLNGQLQNGLQRQFFPIEQVQSNQVSLNQPEYQSVFINQNLLLPQAVNIHYRTNGIIQPKQANIQQKNENYEFSIQFETNSGIRSQTFQVLKSKTMNEVLPEFLKALAAAGFDWDVSWKSQSDYQDKLAISYGQQQYRKYSAKFMSVLANWEIKRTHDFQFRRLYQGG